MTATELKPSAHAAKLKQPKWIGEKAVLKHIVKYAGANVKFHWHVNLQCVVVALYYPGPNGVYGREVMYRFMPSNM